MVELKSDGGRYPYQLAPYRPDEIRATLQVEGDQIRIRIDDLRNPDRWEELVGDARAIMSALLGEEIGRAKDGATDIDLTGKELQTQGATDGRDTK